jgi:glycolate oxidase FAD binding subunit
VTVHSDASADAFTLGLRTPSRVANPRTFDELSSVLRECDGNGDAVVLFGGATLQGLGRLPERYDVAVSLAALDRTLAYEPRDLTIALEAGVTLDALARTLATHGQFVPFDAPYPQRGTVGGALASGWLGPRRATYGRPRDYVIGTTVALADGTLASAGGMVVKNVTGYDTSRLYAGSLGTLAALARVNLKTLPLPPARRLAIAPLPEASRDRALAHVDALRPEPSLVLAVRGFDTEVDGASGLDGRILVLYEGSRATVDAAMRALRSALGAAGVAETTLHDDADRRVQRAIDAYVTPLGARSSTYRCGGDSFDAGERADRLARLAARHELASESICDGRTGDVIVRVSCPLTADFAKRGVAFDRAIATTFSAIRPLASPRTLRASLEATFAEPPAAAMMHALKSRFDPKLTLAPGRIARGL